MPIPFIDLSQQQARLKDDLDRRIQTVLNHGQYIMGPEVTELEEALCAYTGCKHVVSVSSGTDALLAVLMAKGIGQGDAVFLPAFTFPATAEVITLLGATPVFVDVLTDTCTMDSASLADQINLVKSAGLLEAKAVIVVDLYGLPADYAALRQIADNENLFLMDDAAQSFGATQGGRKVGTLADATTASFFPAKPLGCYGDGGAVLTDDDELAQALKSIRAHGKGGAKYDIVRVGLNARLDTIQAAILLSKLTIFDDELGRRESISRFYDARLGNSVTLPGRREDSTSAWAQYTIRHERRDVLADGLKERGIPTNIYYPCPMHRQPAYQYLGNAEGAFPVSEKLSCDVLSLPMHPYLSDEDAGQICDAVTTILSQ